MKQRLLVVSLVLVSIACPREMLWSAETGQLGTWITSKWWHGRSNFWPRKARPRTARSAVRRGRVSRPWSPRRFCVTAGRRTTRWWPRALKYLEGFVQSDGGVYRAGSLYGNYETWLAIMCFTAANGDGRYNKA